MLVDPVSQGSNNIEKELLLVGGDGVRAVVGVRG